MTMINNEAVAMAVLDEREAASLYAHAESTETAMKYAQAQIATHTAINAALAAVPAPERGSIKDSVELLTLLMEASEAIAEARELVGTVLTTPTEADREAQAEAMSLIMQQHYLDPQSARMSPDNLSACVCGEWSEGSMEPGWDDHLADVLAEAGFRRTPVPAPTEARHDHSGEPKVWCETHQHVHIASIPRFTFQCKSCGFGAWYKPTADEHEQLCPDHETYEVEHVMRPLPAPIEADRETLREIVTGRWCDDSTVDAILAAGFRRTPVPAPKIQDGEAREATHTEWRIHIQPGTDDYWAHAVFNSEKEAVLNLGPGGWIERREVTDWTPVSAESATSAFEAMGLPPLPPFPSIHPEGGE